MGRKTNDYPLEKLLDYRPELTNKPPNFWDFWDKEKYDLQNELPDISITWRSYPVPSVEVADIVMESWDKTPLKGIMVKPKQIKKGPVITVFHGYTGFRGHVAEYLKWVTLGLTVISFDVRGQGDSPDFGRYNNGSRVHGWMLHGIQDHRNYYYTNVYRDVITQLIWIRSIEFPIEVTKLGAMGGSQGAGLAIAAAGLDGKLDFLVADYPFLTHFERAIEIALTGPYLEIVKFFKLNDSQYETYDNVLKTLGYVDSMHFCGRITCPTLMSIGLEDTTTPPSTVFAAYNHLVSVKKQIEIYPQFEHEENLFHEEKKLKFIASLIT